MSFQIQLTAPLLIKSRSADYQTCSGSLYVCPYINKFSRCLSEFGKYDSQEQMIASFSAALREQLQFEIELEQCKIQLWKQEDFSTKTLYKFLLSQTNSKQTQVLDREALCRGLKKLELQPTQKSIDLIIMHFSKEKQNQTLTKILSLEELGKIFQLSSFCGKFIQNQILVYNSHKQLAEKTLKLVHRVFKVLLNQLESLEISAYQLCQNRCNFNICYQQIEKQNGFYITAYELKSFLEKYHPTEFININDVELLINRYDRNEKKYLNYNDLFERFIPKLVHLKQDEGKL